MSSRSDGSSEANRERLGAERVRNALQANRTFLMNRALATNGTSRGTCGAASDDDRKTVVLARGSAGRFHATTRAVWRAWLRTRFSRLTRGSIAPTVVVGVRRRSRPVDAGASPSRSESSRKRSEALADALLWLDPVDYELLRLRHEARLEFEAIAGRLGLPSADEARTRHGRAVDQLRKILGPSRDPS